ncbi:MAG: hypothetical protein JNM09_17375 [Blastocatellia bacterium]|nr:hypothetical protein [Blastocatellia bacterium]
MLTEPQIAAQDEGIAETASERLDRLGIYGEIKRELIKRGIPANEIAFIHDFDTPAKKTLAFADANAGRIRIMLASTEKAGTGVNMQERLFALHHLDAPWRPADVEQREGRILRQGNRYGEVRIFNYVTENSFDGYMWQTLENKARFIAQIMTGEVTARTAEDVDDLVMTAAQVKAIASGNPRILERVSIEVELARLSRLYSVWRKSRHHLRWEAEAMPRRVFEADERVAAHQQAIRVRDQRAEPGDSFTISLRRSLETTDERTFTERAPAGEHLERLRRQVGAQTNAAPQMLGLYRGFQLLAQKQRDREEAFFTPVVGWFTVPEGKLLYEFKFSDSATGTMQSIESQLRSLNTHLSRALQAQSELRHKQELLTTELSKGWEYAPNYEALQQQLQVVNQALAADGSEVGDAPTYTPLDAEALRVCAPAPVRQMAASVNHSAAVAPSFVTPDAAVADLPPPDLPMPSPPMEPARVTLEELRQQAKATPTRKSARATSTSQMSLW